MHLHTGQLRQNVGHFLKDRPVELDILAGADVSVALVVVARNVCQLAYLGAAQQAVGHGDAQHGRQALYVETVLQAQWQKLRIAQFAGKVAPGLVSELCHALVDYALVVLVVNIHRWALSPAASFARRYLTRKRCAELC